MNLIEDFQTRIDARMAEIRPIAQEYHALQQLRSAINTLDPEALVAHIADFPIPGISGGPGMQRAAGEGIGSVTQLNPDDTPAGGRAKRTPGGKRRGRPAAGERRATTAEDIPPLETADDTQEARIVELVKTEPGMTAGQLAERLDLPVSVLFRTLPVLQRDGLVRKQGKGFSGV